MTFRRTKIICTIGPATAKYPVLKQMAEAGMNLVRLNMSHADHAGAAQIIQWIKTLNRQAQDPISVMLDTQGPEIRTGDVAEPMDLKTGQVVSLSVRGDDDVETSSIQINYQELVDIVEPGNRITVDNGLINFEVLENRGKRLLCRVIDGGWLGSKRHVNLPGVRIDLPSITAKDRVDIGFGLEREVDYIAVSFVRTAEDVELARSIIRERGARTLVVAKIEDWEGVSNIDAITQAADGVMVARGDLGIETNIADLPNVQRRIVHACARWGRRCIVATHLLESMIHKPIPTRAEVTDVANAVYEGADAVMLSGETSIGQHPVRCVEQLVQITEAAERYPGLGYERSLEAPTDKQQLAIHAVALAESIKADGIVVITRRGITADLVTNAPPADCADLRLHQRQPHSSASVFEPGRGQFPYGVQQRAGKNPATGVHHCCANVVCSAMVPRWWSSPTCWPAPKQTPFRSAGLPELASKSGLRHRARERSKRTEASALLRR